jgi:hypothetical protein
MRIKRNIKIQKEYKMAEEELTYVLYLIQAGGKVEKQIFLGTGKDPVELYQYTLNPQTATRDIKSSILKWLVSVDANLNEQEQREMDYAFIGNPENEFSYSINDMTLVIKQIKQI